jgi:retron-type reverse transcriptase
MKSARNGWSEGVASSSFGGQPCEWEESVSQAKPFTISKQLVWEAYKRVKANQGAAGVDSESVEQFELKLKDNLYKIWNRMSSGAYFPPPSER